MKKYTLEIILGDDLMLEVNGTNDGFTALELMGMLDWKKRDIENQLFRDIKPDIVSRKVIREDI